MYTAMLAQNQPNFHLISTEFCIAQHENVQETMPIYATFNKYTHTTGWKSKS